MINLHLTKITKFIDLENLELYGISTHNIRTNTYFDDITIHQWCWKQIEGPRAPSDFLERGHAQGGTML